ncbi:MULTISPECIES: hypothetical protein [Rhodococcus]|uniref:hypothetical protein n=1 Tax=Rhodococcus TaxID=1827 RepID=UPI001246D7C1|nr:MULTISPECIES: hypothetical protein [Rhodococcus]MCJ0950356.1 hypothetical protein [Rhodococcus sp. ARC_M8]QEX10883.1 hypothetical protein F6X56_14745 [Rhodococcus erythropolis]UKO88896.1 hypothetical protein ITJ47_14260 [Rhodococcus erythropolis]
MILVGLLIAGFIYGLACFLHTQNPRDTTPIAILQLMGVVVLISTAVTAIVYNLHSMTLTDSGVTIKNWGSLFFSSETHCDWNEIEDLNVQRGGPLAFVGGYAELTIQTASAVPRMTFKYCPRPEYWRDYIDQRSESTPELVRNV